MKINILSIIILLFLSVVLTGCAKITHLGYVKPATSSTSSTTDNVINVNMYGDNVPTYSQDVPFGKVSIALLEYEEFSIVMARVDNTSDKPVSISPYDFKLKTKSNYILRQIHPYAVVNYAIAVANGQKEKADNMKVGKEYYVASRTYSSATGNVSGTSFGNSSYYTGNAYGTSTSNTTIGERVNPYDSLAKGLNQWSAGIEGEFANKLANEFEAHALLDDFEQEANSWNYYILSFEKSKEYPVIVFYKENMYEFTNSGRVPVKY